MIRPVVIVLLVLAVTACTTDRPSPAEWGADWARVRDVIPEAPAPGDAIPEKACERTVALLRDQASHLAPTPDDALDAAVNGWLSFARTLFFECPVITGENAGWQAGYRELERRGMEVADVLAQLSQA